MTSAVCCFTGEVLEQAVLLSVRLKDEAAVERNFTQLKTYYTDTRRGSSACGHAAVCAPLLAHLKAFFSAAGV